MEYVTLNNGIKMPMAGIGTFLLTPDEAEASVLNALACGYRLIDTANAYVNEKAVGRAMKKSGVSIPIGLVGGVYDPAVAEEVLAKGQADYVLMARSAMADPELVKKAKEGREDDIRPCLRCNYCMDHGRRVAISKDLHLLT